MLTQLIVIIVFLWAGMILGISFLESWAKFHAPSLTRPIGLDVGRTVFNYFHKVQTVLALLVIALIIFASVSFEIYLMLGGLILILCIQSIWLLPRLNERVSIIIAGDQSPPSFVHAFYGMVEIAKFILLCVSGIILTF
ncbi:MAG: hypothetical protein KIT56_08870 [Gammaproteobacteria bacterium]|nr:hypothetical protein [Gammaproteobacteria bacterium]MCW5583968.1 hypothetical protein [Gammaproteobacteria bacterium]